MPSKRKSNTSSGSGGVKKLKPAHSESEFNDFYSSTLKLIHELKDEDEDRLLVTPFVKLPSKKLYPDYYTVINNPITVSDIQRKHSKGKYSLTNFEEFLADFKLLHDNAIAYNDPDSWIAQDAKKIYEFVKQQVEQFSSSEPADLSAVVPASTEKEGNEGSSSEITLDKLYELCIETIEELINHEFPEIGVISGPFIEDIDRKEYPDYFKIVEHPTSFNRVLGQLKKRKLFSSKNSMSENLSAFHDATSLIFSNAQLYNDPSSLIHQDSIRLNDLFEEKYSTLKSPVEGTAPKTSNKIKLKLKTKKDDSPSVKKENTSKIKLNLKLNSATEQKPNETSKRGRKKKKPLEPEPAVKTDVEADETVDTSAPVLDNQQSSAAVEQAQPDSDINQHGHTIEDKDQTEQKISYSSGDEVNAMGKTDLLLAKNEVYIQAAGLSSSMSKLNQITQQFIHQTQQQKSYQPSRSDTIKRALFPTHSEQPTITFFDYNFPATGYSSQAYSLALPSEAAPFITFKVSLHHILREIKSGESISGQGLASLNSEDEFQCKLYVNDEEVTSGGELSGDSLLTVSYDLKLNYGLNLINFECNVSPNIGKKIKKNLEKPESDEIAGRYTRHQFQQMKMTWDVEKFSLAVIYTGL
ncbi:Piso0_004987 [Millerozyma farinosa CBS 7064]|uniref:Piso0_004987 protein n=1 Tax=Pichia sorbitophila (strain ATCC MYA-4447 / BCRC 22081 / CBS 7064 / NBRC 10061 / NRRL Y-12695) TaxID=559304 RepID=G8Y3X3_PICSO|nr:Piso0_004987 [Millerozyma farinosa CBS 7064]